MSLYRNRFAFALSALMALGFSAASFAADNNESSADIQIDAKHPCKADREKFCGGEKWKDGAGQCLDQHLAELSAQCKSKVETWKTNHPCFEDRMKFCKDLKGHGGGLGKCMKEHESELSASCKAKFEERVEARKARRLEKKAQGVPAPSASAPAAASSAK